MRGFSELYGKCMMPPQLEKWKFPSVRLLLIALFVASLTACGAVGFPGVYRINVEQGNIVDQEMVDQLKPGMSRRQVRFIMGTPLVEDTFNSNRWDYPYSVRNGGQILRASSVSVFFEGDSLVNVTGDVLPEWAGGPGPDEDDASDSEGEASAEQSNEDVEAADSDS